MLSHWWEQHRGNVVSLHIQRHVQEGPNWTCQSIMFSAVSFLAEDLCGVVPPQSHEGSLLFVFGEFPSLSGLQFPCL